MLPPTWLLSSVSPALALLAQEPVMPRGPGLYFHPLKLVLLLIVYLCWVRTVWWVDADARIHKLHREQWSLTVVGCGVAGLALVFLLPWFWISIMLLLALYLGPVFTYVYLRNQEVDEADRVLTPAHMQRLSQRLFGMRRREKKAEDTGPEVRFFGKSSRQSKIQEDVAAKVEGSKGFKAAKQMVYDAVNARATDIHLEPTQDEMVVRFRIDGMLLPSDPFGRSMGESVINIFKVLCDMDIAERRKPQDGSFSAKVDRRNFDMRVATAGSVNGEKLVMRLLDNSQQIISLPQLGMRDKMQEQVKEIVDQPHGILIVCGPTGAGKSTTLYACLKEIDRFQRNVITIENPVEYKLHNVTQIEVNPKAGKTFASELRSILRQDPDVILIGEIRDQETAEIACQAAQTGHMVFTTLHANDTVTAIGRLIDLGVKPYLIANALSAVLGQRLVRLLCASCKVKYKPSPDLLRRANLPADKIKYFYRAPDAKEEPEPPPADNEDDDEVGEKGPGRCADCGGTAYHGRTGIFEMLVVTDAVKDLIRANPDLNAIRQQAVKEGMTYLQEDGLRKVIEGKTSIQELLRVCK